MKKVVLCILDGWGHIEKKEYNAVLKASTPFYTKALQTCAHSLLEASGSYVGLPDGQMGNSEVGHLTIGAGRRMYQELPKISMSLAKGEFAKLPAIQKLVEEMAGVSNVCHIVGLVSNGGVHGHIDHIIKIAAILKEMGVKVVLHAILDGRDTAPKSAINFLKKVKEAGINIGTMSGRFYAMDRDKRWDRVQKAYDAIALGASDDWFNDPIEYVESQYESDITDEFIEPVCNKHCNGIQDGDAILFTNYRADRMREICDALVSKEHADLKIREINYSCKTIMRPYSSDLASVCDVVFPYEPIVHTLGEVISNNNLKQLRIAETEKYAHVTYFFNGGEEKLYAGEDRILVPSPKVATYDLKPEMSAVEITDKLTAALDTKQYSFVCVNYANADMVGHSGMMDATVKAVETVDLCLARLAESCAANGYDLMITADHGNAECMFDEKTNQPLTSHTTNKVPFVYIGESKVALRNGELADIAPTILSVMGIAQPEEMGGKSLFVV